LVEIFLEKQEKIKRLAIGAFLFVATACAIGTFT
jgi:hypothetical protein